MRKAGNRRTRGYSLTTFLIALAPFIATQVAGDGHVASSRGGCFGLTRPHSRVTSLSVYRSVSAIMTTPQHAGMASPQRSLHESQRPRWPAHLKELCRELRTCRDDTGRSHIRGEVWLLLHSAISMYARVRAAEYEQIGAQDIEDVASEKALDLLLKAESGAWDMYGHQPSDVAAFLSTVARNGLRDLARRCARLVPLNDDYRLRSQMAAIASAGAPVLMGAPDALAQRREFTIALRECANKLGRRSRLAWFFRVFYNMPSKEIAVHPGISIKDSHVDVVLQRARHTISDCMSRRGFDTHEIPPGTFVELWKAFRLEEIRGSA
jgi:RNA polymerase sigma factor (sigma-70 family)